MVRPRNLPEPLATLANQAGSEAALRSAMGGVPNTTFFRWVQALRRGDALPRSAAAAINLAQRNLKQGGA